MYEDSLILENWERLKRNRAAMLGLAIVIVLLLTGLFAPVIATHDPLAQNIDLRLSAPGQNGYFLGSDDFGRDVFSRIVYGARLSIIIGAIAIVISSSIGILLGLLAGYFGGKTDIAVTGITDIMLAFPPILLAIVAVATLGPSLQNAMVAIGIVGVPRFTRVVRASVMAEKECDYVTAERSLGVSETELMFRSILPNCLAPIIVQVTLGYAGAILFAAALSFLGLGTQPPTPEWGLMLASAKQFVTTAWWVVTFPGLAILISVLGFNLFGDGLRDVLDPRLKD